MTAASWFHCSVKPVSRSAGRSVVAAAAYRLGACLHDAETGQLHDYRRRHGVVQSFTLAPDHAPDWAQDPARLWNAANAAETRSNSTLAREVELALPASLGEAAREGIVRAFAAELVARYGVAVTAALHAPSTRGEGLNHHAHLLMTTRRLEADGIGAKTRILDDRKTGPQEVTWLRERAAQLINDALGGTGSAARVDHRSLAARGIVQEPTTHLGPRAAAMEQRGARSERGDHNRAVRRVNRLKRAEVALAARIAAEETRVLGLPAETPAMAAVQVGIAARRMLRPGRAQHAWPAFAAPRDAREAAAQVEAVAGILAAGIQQLGHVPEIVAQLVEDGRSLWERLTHRAAALAEETGETLRRWTSPLHGHDDRLDLH